MWEKLILPRLGELKVAELTHEQVDSLHAEIGKTRPVRANRTIEVLRKGLNLAIRWGWRADNPAIGTHRNREERRTRYLTPAEIVRVVDALRRHPERISASAITLMLLTGARRNEVLQATWDMFDLETGIWVKPSCHTKQKREHRVPLSSAALELLREVQKTTAGPYVFPGKSGRPLVDVKRTWASVCETAGLTEPVTASRQRSDVGAGRPPRTCHTVRIHDLRHTYAAVLASQGLSLPIIGALLGHSQPQTTARYAHLLDDPLRAATERAGQILNVNRQPATGQETLEPWPPTGLAISPGRSRLPAFPTTTA